MDKTDYTEFIDFLNQLQNNSKYNEFLLGINNCIQVIKTGYGLLQKINKNIPVYIEGLHDVIKYLNDLPEKTTEALRILYNYGWYLDIHNIDMVTIHFLSIDRVFNENEINKFLTDKYNKLLDKILEQSNILFPHRNTFITKAFLSHKNGDYELSIPVLLAQIDGMCFDFTKYEYFRKTKNFTPKTAKFINDLKVNELFNRLLEPLKKTTPLSQNTDINELYNNYILNRHMIMHGKDINYANELNSCKVISFLAYIVSIFNYIKKKK